MYHRDWLKKELDKYPVARDLMRLVSFWLTLGKIQEKVLRVFPQLAELLGFLSTQRESAISFRAQGAFQMSRVVLPSQVCAGRINQISISMTRSSSLVQSAANSCGSGKAKASLAPKMVATPLFCG